MSTRVTKSATGPRSFAWIARSWAPLLLVLVVVAVFSIINNASPLARSAGIVSTSDSADYLYVGKTMYQGGLPYVDAFDHKGPLQYLLNLLGYSIHHRWGVWLIESVFLAAGTWCCYRLARRFGGVSVAIAATTVTMAAYAEVYEGGNLPEDYALALIFAALLLMTRYFLEDDFSGLDMLGVGALGGAVVLLKPNIAGPWVVFALFIVFWGAGRSLKDRARELLLLVGGGIAVCLPFAAFFVAHGAFGELYRSYIFFNLGYAHSTLRDKAMMLLWSHRTMWLLLPVACFYLIVPFRSSERRALHVFLAASFVMTIALSSLSGRQYLQYLIPLVPFLVPPIAEVLSWATESMERFWRPVVLASVVVLMLLPPAVTFRRPIVQAVDGSNRAVATANVIKKLTAPGERILVFGNSSEIYLESDRMSASKYFYQAPILAGSAELTDQFFRELAKRKPRVIVVSNYTSDDPQWQAVVSRMDDYLRRGYRRSSVTARVGSAVPNSAEVYVRTTPDRSAE